MTDGPVVEILNDMLTERAHSAVTGAMIEVTLQDGETAAVTIQAARPLAPIGAAAYVRDGVLNQVVPADAGGDE